MVVYSTVGWVVCIIVIVSFQLSLSPLILAVLTLLEITPTLSSSQGKPAISAASGHSNLRKAKAGGRQRKGNAGRSQPVHQAQGQRSKARLARPASLSLALVLSHTPLSHHSLYALLLSRLEPACQCLSLFAGSQQFCSLSLLQILFASHRSSQHRRTSSLQARLLPPRLPLLASLLPPACLPRTQDRERHDSIPVASL